MAETTIKTIGVSISDHFTVPWAFMESIIATFKTFPDIKIVRAHGSLIHDNRNFLLKTGVAPLLMVDTDMVFTPDDVKLLLETMESTGADIVGGLYKQGYPPYPPAVFDDNLNIISNIPKEPFEAGAMGMGFTLLNHKALGGESPFDPIIDATQRHGEDVSFCIRAKQRGLKIVCEPRVNLGHLRLRPV